MEPIADRKYYFAPLDRQRKAIERLLKAGRHRNLTEFMRAAIDHYLDGIGRPPLSEQAREMAAEWEASRETAGLRDADELQAGSMEGEEDW